MGKKKKGKKKGPDPEELERQKDHKVKLMVEASVQTRVEELAHQLEVSGQVDKMSFPGTWHQLLILRFAQATGSSGCQRWFLI